MIKRLSNRHFRIVRPIELAIRKCLYDDLYVSHASKENDVFFVLLFHILFRIAIWGNAAKAHTNSVLVLQKKAVCLMQGLPYNEHIKLHTVVNYLLMIDDVHKHALTLFTLRYCILEHN